MRLRYNHTERKIWLLLLEMNLNYQSEIGKYSTREAVLSSLKELEDILDMQNSNDTKGAILQMLLAEDLYG